MKRRAEFTHRDAAPILISRREALLATLAGLLVGAGSQPLRAQATVPVPTAAKPKLVKLFTASGAGDRDGRDWENAIPVAALSRAFDFARPGSGFVIGVDPAGEPIVMDGEQIRITASGAEGNPVFLEAGLIAGDDGVAAAASEAAGAFFRSARPWSVEDFGEGGSSYFALADGASHLRISGFHIDGTPPDGFFKFRGKPPSTYQDIVISGIEAKNVGRVIETQRGASLRNLVVTDCRAFGIVRGFARFRDITDSTLRNLDLDAANLDAGGKNVCQLIAVSAGDNLLFENIVLRNAINQPPPKKGNKQGYVQGDGIVCERKTSNITIRNCHATGMGDGGFDLKTTNVTLEDCSTDSCKFGARIWVEGDNVIRRCDFRNPVSRNEVRGACIQAGGMLEIIETKLHAGEGTAAISLNQNKGRNPPRVVMRGGSIKTEGDGKVVRASAEGVLELEDVMVNGVPTTRRFVFEKKKA